METLSYIFFGPWQSIVSMIIIMIGLIIITLPYLVHPVHGFKFRSVFGAILIITGIVGILCTLLIGREEITPSQYQNLVNESKTYPEAKQLIQKRLEANQRITRIDYITLQRELNKKKRQHFIREITNEHPQ